LNLAVLIGKAAGGAKIASRHGFRRRRAKPFYTSLDAAMRQGERNPQSTRTQHFPPSGRFRRSKALALGGFLGFNLNKIG
jgi:hypothetical protein